MQTTHTRAHHGAISERAEITKCKFPGERGPISNHPDCGTGGEDLRFQPCEDQSTYRDAHLRRNNACPYPVPGSDVAEQGAVTHIIALVKLGSERGQSRRTWIRRKAGHACRFTAVLPALNDIFDTGQKSPMGVCDVYSNAFNSLCHAIFRACDAADKFFVLKVDQD